MLSSRMCMLYCIHTSIKLLMFSCICRRPCTFEIDFATWQDNRCLPSRKIRKSHFRNALLVPESYWPYTPFFTDLSERLIERLHIFPMKDYNAYILEYITKTLVPGFSSFLTIYIPELWQ